MFFQLGSSSFAFLTFSVSRSLGETVIYCDLEEHFYEGAPLCRLCAPVFLVWMPATSSSGMLAVIPFIEVTVGAGCEVRLHLCSVATAVLTGVESAPPSVNRSPEGLV